MWIKPGVVAASQGIPVLSFTGAVSQNEGDSGSTDLTLTLNVVRNGVTAALPFTWSFTGGTAVPDDFTEGLIPSGSGTFQVGEVSKQIVIAISGDTTIETNDTLQITAVLSDYPAVSATTLGTILNDDYVTLGDLTLDDTSFAIGTSKTVNIVGAAEGSTIAFSGLPSSMTVNSSAQTLTYDGTGSASSFSITPTETLAGATNTPHTSPAIALTISASVSYVDPYLLDVTAPAANSPLTSQPGWTIASGTTSGFIFTGTPQKLKTPNLGSGNGVFRDAGSNNFYVRAQYYPAVGSRNRFLLRWTDWNNYIYVEINNTAPQGLQIIRVVSGTPLTIQANITMPTLPGQDQFEMTVINDILNIKWNGGLVRTSSYTASYNVADVPASSKVGYMAQSNFVYGNVEVGAVDVSTRRVTVNEVAKVTQRERSGANAGKATIGFSGTYNGTAPNRFRIYNTDTGTDISGFSAQAMSPAASSGIWTLSGIVLPASVTEYRAEFWCSDLPLMVARTNGFYVGELIIGYGQSGANEMGGTTDIAASMPSYTHNPAAWYFCGISSQVYWTRATRSASAAGHMMLGKMASDLADALNVAVGIVFVGSGGQEIKYLQKGNTDAASAQLYSKLGYGNGTTNTSLTQLNLLLGKFGTVLYVHQGASDVPCSYEYYYGTDGTTGLTKLFNDIRTDFGLGAGGADMYALFDILDINSTGSTTEGLTVASESSTSRGWASVRRAYHDFGSQAGNFWVSSACMDVSHAVGDGLHRDGPGYYLTQQRIQRSLMKVFGIISTDGRGPLPTGVTRSGSDLIIQYSANGCIGISKGSGTTPSNYQIGTDTTFGTVLTPASYDVDGTAMTVTLHFGSALPSGTAIRTFQTANVTQADLIRGTYSDGTPDCVLYPIFNTMTAA